jgi:hypothetical protein
MPGTIEIIVCDVNDVEAQVLAQYLGPADHQGPIAAPTPIVIKGTLRGPFCETARTLPAEFRFHNLGPTQPGRAKVVVPDPCIWSPELPHLYQVDVEARRDGELVAEYHGIIGLRRAAKSNE